jgi:hypothetical protein
MNSTASHAGTGQHDPGLWMWLRKAGLILAAVMLAGVLCGSAFRYQDIPLKGATCFYCHRKATLLDRIERVHVEPQSVNPARINDPTNIVLMHRSCHAVLQHRWNFHTYNPDMLRFIEAYTNWLPCRRGE